MNETCHRQKCCGRLRLMYNIRPAAVRARAVVQVSCGTHNRTRPLNANDTQLHIPDEK